MQRKPRDNTGFRETGTIRTLPGPKLRSKTIVTLIELRGSVQRRAGSGRRVGGIIWRAASEAKIDVPLQPLGAQKKHNERKAPHPHNIASRSPASALETQLGRVWSDSEQARDPLPAL